MFYGYALMEPSGIHFVAVQRHRRRCVERVSIKTFNEVSRHWSPYQQSSINDDADEQAASLVPSLLAVNKQIHQEGSDILYSNELVFADSVALYAFMINLGPASAAHLKKMRIKGWHSGRTSKAYNNACFAVLVWATNLEKLYIDDIVRWWRGPVHAAQQIYRDAFPWLEAVGHGRGRFDAALDVLEMSEGALRCGYSGAEGTNVQKRKMFTGELRRNLSLQQKRIMTASSKRRKVSKVSD